MRSRSAGGLRDRRRQGATRLLRTDSSNPQENSMSVRPTHTDVVVPAGVREPRFRPPAGTSAETLDLNGDWRFRLFGEAVTGADAGDDGSSGTPWPSPATGSSPVRRTRGRTACPRTPTCSSRSRSTRRGCRDENPTGEYRRPFEVPGSLADAGRVVLRFEGVDSWFEVSVNGSAVATSHGSRLPTEIDVTEQVHEGEQPARRPRDAVVRLHLRRRPGPVVALRDLPLTSRCCTGPRAASSTSWSPPSTTTRPGSGPCEPMSRPRTARRRPPGSPSSASRSGRARR